MSRFLPIIALAACSVAVWADDAQVYESLREIDIGRVFLTPDERRTLDHRRRQPTSTIESSSAEQGTDTTPDKQVSPSASGYIVVGSGNPKRWQDGDFVGTAPGTKTDSLRFPGDVRIVRHAPDSDPVNATDPQKPEEADREN